MTRRRYRYDEETKQVVEVGSDWTNAERKAPVPTEQLTYGGMQATDGTDISSRKKHREYMKQHGLTTAEDYKQSWEKATKEREEFREGKRHDPSIRDDLQRAFYRRFKP